MDEGLKTTYYLRSRPATRISRRPSPSRGARENAVACSLENPEHVRPAGDTQALLDPGMDLTLRPMRYPLFY